MVSKNLDNTELEHVENVASEKDLELEQIIKDSQDSDKVLDRRTKLLYAAREVFLEYGYVKANLDQIIEMVGGSRRNIYNEFGNKQGLFLATIEYFSEKIFSPKSEDILIEGNNFREILENFGKKSILSLFEEQNLKFIHLLLTEAITCPEIYTKFYDVILHNKVKLPLLKILQYARDTKELVSELEDDFIADFIIASVRGQVDPRILYYYKDEPVKKERVEGILKKSLDFVFAGLCSSN